MRLFFCALVLMFVVSGCAGVQTGGSGGEPTSSKQLTKDDYKRIGVDENKGM